MIAVILGMIINITLISCELRFVWTMFRHGARAPQSGLSAGNIDMLGQQWVNPGELTAVGMRMHYLLGHRNRLRYGTFLSNTYTPLEIYIKSSDFNRTIMSAQAQLQGLYPPPSGPTLSNAQQNIAYPPDNNYDLAQQQSLLGSSALMNGIQVFPIHVFDTTDPNFFFVSNPTACTPLINVLLQNEQNPTIQNFLTKFNTTYGAQLLNLFGKTSNPNYFMNYNLVSLLFDTFLSDYTDQRNLTALANAGIDLVAFNNSAYEFHFNDMLLNYNGDTNLTFAKIVMSSQLRDVLNWMTWRIGNDTSGNQAYTGYGNPKYVMYSEHDFTLGSAQAFLNAALGPINEYAMSYASNLFIELWRPDNVADPTTLKASDYYVNIIYNEHVLLASVSFPTFNSSITNLTWSPNDVFNFCGFNTTSQNAVFNSYYYATVALSCICFVLVCGIIVFFIVYLMGKRNSGVMQTDKPITSAV
jgi:hypothetical protein